MTGRIARGILFNQRVVLLNYGARSRQSPDFIANLGVWKLRNHKLLSSASTIYRSSSILNTYQAWVKMSIWPIHPQCVLNIFAKNGHDAAAFLYDITVVPYSGKERSIYSIQQGKKVYAVRVPTHAYYLLHDSIKNNVER